jgi:hypothetical protein
MTSEEIKKTPATDVSERAWLKEIALQLALLNEKKNPYNGRPHK